MNFLSFHFDYNYIKSLCLSIVEVVYPITLRKIWCYFTYTMIGIIIQGSLIHIPSSWKYITNIIHWYSLEFALFILLIDPFFIIISMLFSCYGELPNQTNNIDKNKDIAIIIPTHGSYGIIEVTIKSCLRHVNGNQIFICDNNNSNKPIDNIWEEIRNIDDTINYHYNPVGNKTRAQFMGIMSEKHNFKYSLLIDDDVILPNNLNFKSELFSDDTNLQCLVYPLTTQQNKSLLVEWQDIEYKLSGLIKNVQSNISSIIAPHGGISLWRTPILKRILVEHDTIFYGDDTKMGLYLLNRGFSSKFVPEVLVQTVCPRSFMGKTPNLYEQRVCSWDSTEHVLTLQYIELFLRSFIRTSLTRSIILRVFELKILIDIVSDWIKILVFIHFYESTNFWYWIGFGIGANLIILFIWNYIKCYKRPDIRCSLLSVSTFWIYKCITSVFRILALIRCYLSYIPRYKRPIPIFLEDDTQNLKVNTLRWSEYINIFKHSSSDELDSTVISPIVSFCNESSESIDKYYSGNDDIDSFDNVSLTPK